MGSKELVESLRRAADERIKLIWQETEGEAEKVREEVSHKLDQLRENCSRTASLAVTAAQVSAVSEANNRSRTRLLTAEKALSERLYSVALSSLLRLRGSDYREVFGRMARELPLLAWKIVRVNPEDAGLAESIFTGAEIIPDKAITGGVDAMTDGGKIRVINTFEKRLERAWVDMLPELLKIIYDVVEESP
ncbi:MAG TPA: V-type ATP synthase subunit E [Nitrospirota bacterium]|nr:V-type ATP synthase subunit E [Nitrospirota bacterium]